VFQVQAADLLQLVDAHVVFDVDCAPVADHEVTDRLTFAVVNGWLHCLRTLVGSAFPPRFVAVVVAEQISTERFACPVVAAVAGTHRGMVSRLCFADGVRAPTVIVPSAQTLRLSVKSVVVGSRIEMFRHPGRGLVLVMGIRCGVYGVVVRREEGRAGEAGGPSGCRRSAPAGPPAGPGPAPGLQR